MSIARSLARPLAKSLANSIAPSDGDGLYGRMLTLNNAGKLSAWYDTSDLSNMWLAFDETGGNVTADGDTIGKVDDVSGNTLHFLQSTATKEPQFKIRTNGSKTYNAIYSPGVDELLTGTPSMTAAGGKVLVFGVDGAAQATKTIYSEGSTSSGLPYYWVYVSSGNVVRAIRDDAAAATVTSNTTSSPLDGTPHVITIIDSGSNIKMRVDGGVEADDDYTRPSPLTLDVASFFSLKRTTESAFFAGDIISPVFADISAVSTAEIRTMEAYIANIMGIALS